MSDKRSYVSRKHLRQFYGTKIWYSCFAHVLSKSMSKYPYFRYYAKNIVLLEPNEHFMWDQGTEEQRINYALDIEEKTNGNGTADWDRLKALETELKAEYKKYFPSTYQGMLNYRYSMDEILPVIFELNKKFFESLK